MLRRSFNAMDAWTKQVLTLHTNRSTPGSVEVSWSGSEKHETNRREHADRNHLSFRGIQKKRRPKDRSVSQKNRRRQAVCHSCRWSGMPTGKVGLKGPRPRQAVGKHGAQKARGSLGSFTGGYAQTDCCGLVEHPRWSVRWRWRECGPRMPEPRFSC